MIVLIAGLAGAQGAQAEDSPDACRAADVASQQYNRLMVEAAACHRREDCQELLRPTLCSNCRVAVNKHSPHVKRLRALEKRYASLPNCPEEDLCRLGYNCGAFMHADCVDGVCVTTAGEPDAQCGSPSPWRIDWLEDRRPHKAKKPKR